MSHGKGNAIEVGIIVIDTVLYLRSDFLVRQMREGSKIDSRRYLF